MSKKTFIIPVLGRTPSAEHRAERGRILETLFAEFGMKDPKIYSTNQNYTSIACADNSAVLFTIGKFFEDTKITITPNYGHSVKTFFTVGKELDFEKFKETFMEMYHFMVRTERDKKQALLDGNALRDRVEPYLKQVVFTATKYGFNSTVSYSPNDFAITLTQLNAVHEKIAVLKFSADMRFSTIEIIGCGLIHGFDYGIYEKKIAEMKNIEAFQIDIEKQFKQPAVVVGAEETVEA